jgi:hypothetical protein
VVSIDKYLADASSVEPPYDVGMACAVCHTASNPKRPTRNPAEPSWENIDSHIGSQYFREGMLFGLDKPRKLVRRQGAGVVDRRREGH